jgi:hypothetical protein
MKIKTSFYVLIFCISAFSCKKEQNSVDTTPKKYAQLEKANWFLGNWENVTEEMTFKEIWKQENDSAFVGESFVTVKKDTVFYEKVYLKERNDSLFYIVSVKEQNKEQPVSFYLTTATDNQVVFENPKHDFPNKIAYNKFGNDSILATIYGIKKGKEVSENFPMKKSK